MSTLEDLSTEPRYTIKAVSTQTGIRSVTIRAWENRYGLLKPQRSNNRYRLYSEKDVAILRWVKSQVDQGTTISNVVQDLNIIIGRGDFPEVLPAITPRVNSYQPVPPAQIADQLYRAMARQDEPASNELLKQATAMYDLTTVCMEVIGASLVKIGEAWHQGEMRITVQHFASNYLQSRLVSLLQAYPGRRGSPLILTACAPEETHEIPALMLSVVLSHRGYRVEYLGPDLPVEDLVNYARQEKAAMLCMSATTEETALSLAKVKEKLAAARTKTIFGYGGFIFNINPDLRKKVPGEFLGESITSGADRIDQLLA